VSTVCIILCFICFVRRLTATLHRKLAWSKSGCIASISRDGAGLNICHLQCHPKNGKWALSKEYAVDQVSATHRNQPLTHVQWSHTGQELAVLDSAGKISILNVAMAMNNLHLSRPAETDQEDDLAEVAGLQWLTYERNVSCRHYSAAAADNRGVSAVVTCVQRGRPMGLSVSSSESIWPLSSKRRCPGMPDKNRTTETAVSEILV